MTAEAVASQFQELYTIWSRHAQELPAVHSLLFASREASGLPREVRFLNLTQCIEAYARTRLGAQYMEQEKWLLGPYLELVKVIPPSITGPHRNALVTRLKWGASHSLRRMIESTVQSMPAVVRHLICCPEVFADDVVELRNGLIHLTEDLSAKAQSLPSIGILTRYLDAVLTCRFLVDLGFTDDRIESLLTSGGHILIIGLTEYRSPRRADYDRPGR